MKRGKRKLLQLLEPYFPHGCVCPKQVPRYQKDVLSELLTLFNGHRAAWSVKSHPGVSRCAPQPRAATPRSPQWSSPSSPLVQVPRWVPGPQRAGCSVRVSAFHPLQTLRVAMPRVAPPCWKFPPRHSEVRVQPEQSCKH